jgi:DNA-binding response OmpR family regulator
MADQKPDSKGNDELSRLRVLLVEDSQFDREIAVAALKKIGIGYLQLAESGTEAMNKIQTAIDVGKVFDLVLLDAKLPAQDGDVVLRWMRKQYKTKSTPVIMVTATSTANEVAAFAELGISGYVVKPLKLEILRTKINSVVSGMRKAAKQAG